MPFSLKAFIKFRTLFQKTFIMPLLEMNHLLVFNSKIDTLLKHKINQQGNILKKHPNTNCKFTLCNINNCQPKCLDSIGRVLHGIVCF